MRININMDGELVKKIDEIAKKMYVSRSAYIAFAVSQKIQQDKTLDNMPDLVQTLKSAVDLEKAKSDSATSVADNRG